LVRTLAVIAGDRLRAEDALQDAFAELCLHWRKVGAYEDPEAWVRKVAINRLRNQERSLLRRSRALLRLGVWEAAKASAAQVGDDFRLRPELRAALLQLPLRQRAAVVLFYVEDLAVADVARCMGITEGAVNRHLHRGRETLRRLLEVRT
jgi:RNA polymerase sigma-70 factor, ECF subfamily